MTELLLESIRSTTTHLVTSSSLDLYSNIGQYCAQNDSPSNTNIDCDSYSTQLTQETVYHIGFLTV